MILLSLHFSLLSCINGFVVDGVDWFLLNEPHLLHQFSDTSKNLLPLTLTLKAHFFVPSNDLDIVPKSFTTAMLQACLDSMPNANSVELSGGSKALASPLCKGRQSVSFSKLETPAATWCVSIRPSRAKDFELSELNSCFDCLWFQIYSNSELYLIGFAESKHL